MAELLGFDRVTVYRFLKSGVLPARRVGARRWKDFWEPKLLAIKKRKPRKPVVEPRNPSKCDTCRYNDPEVESRPCGFCRHRPADSVYGVGWPDYWDPKAEEPKPSAASSDNVCTEGDGHGTTEGG